eukprot:4045422-Pyramimonas_sp.AAC.1
MHANRAVFSSHKKDAILYVRTSLPALPPPSSIFRACARCLTRFVLREPPAAHLEVVGKLALLD